MEGFLAALAVSFGVIFVAELGDKSQLMALTFATRYWGGDSAGGYHDRHDARASSVGRHRCRAWRGSADGLDRATGRRGIPRFRRVDASG
jgi:hypothetical protein